MNKIFSGFKLVFLVLCCISLASCEKEKLKNANKIEVGGGGDFTLNQSQLTIPVKIKLSGSSSRAFSVKLTAGFEELPNLIASNKVDPSTKGLPSLQYVLPADIDIPYGVSSFEFNVTVNRSFLEKYYGDNFAFIIKLSDPSKGNSIDQANNSLLLVIKSGQVIEGNSVHYISFVNAANPLIISAGSTYTIGSQDVTIPVPLSLSGLASESEFLVKVIKSTQAAQALVNKGTIPNLIVLDTASFNIPLPKVKFISGKNTASVEIAANTIAFLAKIGKKVAIGLELVEPGKFQVSKDQNKIVIVIDPDNFRPYNGVPFKILGTIGQASNLIPFAEYDYGGPLVAYKDDAAKTGVASFRAEDMVDVADYTPRSVITGIVANEYLTYSIDVEQDGDYEMNVLLGSTVATGRYSVFVDDVNVSGTLAVANSGNIGYYIPNISTIKLTKGRKILKMFWNVAGFEARGVIFTRKK
jgi:hypothetical protein